jgi:chromosomal replication initiation ATPase DnaA
LNLEFSAVWVSETNNHTNEPRDVATDLLRTLCGQTLQRIVESLSVRNYSTVTTVLTRVER